MRAADRGAGAPLARAPAVRFCAVSMLCSLAVAGCGATDVDLVDSGFLEDAGHEDGGSRDAGPPRDGALVDAPPGDASVACGADLVCPAQMPRRGSPCLSGLECTYSCGGGGPMELTRCIDGAWQPNDFCLPAPVLYESCEEPITTGLPAGIAMSVEPPSAFVWGLQGSAMIEYAIRLAPSADAPSCVRVRSRMTVDGEAVELTRNVRLRCGESLVIVPALPCEVRDYPLVLEVEVIGIGTERIELALPGGMTPGSGRPVCPDGGV
jgi:hypothetical protein